jgi:hypothetical protein
MGRALKQLFKNSRAPNEPDDLNHEALLKMWPQWPRMQLTLTIPIAGSVARGEYRRDGFVYLVDECRGEISWR